ncbi:hypothetical protein [Paraburkholderia youngii]|uniref:Uncharacterized protein n=1 Tax=Paraburkholderia youngii TaxID=2782701 RepID=A0A7Y6JUL7_9BURK|nr:hypothetical protein [Paraburkholderia youngii]NUX98766.1 hypothetical protein [Paraburkholderia youngii]
MTQFDYAAAIAAAAETEHDMNEAQSGGGDYAPPAAGKAGLRFVAYIEIGKQEGTFKGAVKVSDKAFLVFELHGPKWPLNDNGEPQRITVELNKSLNEKAGFYKLFKTMNYEGKAKIMAQLLGNDYIGTVVHRTYKGRDGKDRTIAELYDKTAGAYTVEAPFVEDMDTGETRRRNVPPAITPVKVFLWNSPSKEMWDSIFIDGEYPERKNDKGEVTAPAKSKNKFQLAIRAAKNFKGSPIEALLDGIDDEALNSVGKTPEQAVAEKKASAAAKASSSAGASEEQQASSTASAQAAEPAAKPKRSASTKKTSPAATEKAAESAKLPDQKTASAGADESGDDELGAGDDLPF